MLPHGADAGQPRRDYDGGMARPLAAPCAAAVLAVLAAAPARAQGTLEPSGRLPPSSPGPSEQGPVPPPKTAVAVETPAAPLTRGTVLEQVSGIVREVDRKSHKFTVEVGAERVTLSMDRNTMVYTSAGLGTVLDVVPGAAIRAGRNADFVAYWVQVRPPSGKGTATAPQPPAQGTGPAGGSGAPAERGTPATPPAGTTTPSGAGAGTAGTTP